MKVQKAALALLLAVALLLTGTACAPAHTQEKLLAYQAAPFRLSLRGEIRGFGFAGELSHTPNAESDYHWVFTEPPALCGIEMSLRGEAVTVTQNGIAVADDRWDRLLWREIPALFALQGEPLTVTADREQRTTTAIFQTAGNKAYTVTLDSDTALPREIEGDGIRVEILQFET